jgi:copper chaperone
VLAACGCAPRVIIRVSDYGAPPRFVLATQYCSSIAGIRNLSQCVYIASIGGNGPIGVKAKQPIFKVMREHRLTQMSRSVLPHLAIYWRSEMKFSIKDEIRSDDIATIEHAINTVDADAKVKVDVETKTVSVDSWLMPEEFIVAFDDENYDVKITEW